MKKCEQRMKTGRFLARRYGMAVRSAYAHNEGNWFWTLKKFPGAYFDAEGCMVFQTEAEYLGCVYLTIGFKNTSVRSKAVGMSISDIPGYRKLNPPPRTL
jgi:hypothetical protein